jgi:hypothetical protein
MDCTSVVVGRTESLQIEKDDFAAGYRDVFVGSVRGEAAYAIVNRGGCGSVVNIDEAICRVVRIKRYAEQTTFAGGVDVECYEWCRQHDIVFDHT